MPQSLNPALVELGLTSTEADIYLLLLEKGPTTAGSLSKGVNINRTTTYQVLERLIARGLVSYVQKGKRRIFQAARPETLLKIQEEKLAIVKELVPRLLTRTAPAQEETVIYRGRRGIRTIMNEILQCKKYVSFGSAGQILDVLGHDFLRFQQEKYKRHIKSRVIIGKSSKNTPVVQKAFAQFRFVDDKYMTPTTTWVYADKVAIIVWSAEPIATLIKSKDVAQAYNSYFELLWKTAA